MTDEKIPGFRVVDIAPWRALSCYTFEIFRNYSTYRKSLPQEKKIQNYL
jgi:hypothetical protein